MQYRFHKRKDNSNGGNIDCTGANNKEHHFYDDEVEIFYEDYFGDAKKSDDFINIDLKKVVFPFFS